MSGAGFRGRGPVPRGRNLRGMGPEGVSGIRNPQPNFNQPRREGHAPPQDFWLEHPGPAPWQQNEFQHPHSQYPYDYRFQRGRPQYCSSIAARGRSKRIRGDGRPRGIYQPGGYQMPMARPPQPEAAKFAPLGSEEERQQKIAETADKLKQKLSSLTVEKPVNLWDENLAGVAFESDDQEQHLISNRGIPELRHDPPELNLTVGDFKDIGRVDPEGFGNSTEPQDVTIAEKESEDREEAVSVDSEIYLIDNDEAPGNGTEITGRPKETEKKNPAPEPLEAAESESSKSEEKETRVNHNPELSESLEKLRKVIENDRELEKEGRAAALLLDNRPVFKPSLDFRPEINHPYARFQDHGNNSGESREPRRDRDREQPREQFREQSRFREQFWPDYQRDVPNFGPDFNRYDPGQRNFRPQGPRMNHSEFDGPPRMIRRPMIDHCNMGYENRPPQRFDNFRQDHPRNNSWYNHDEAVLQPPPAFDPRGPPPPRFMNQEPEPIYAPVLPMSYGQQMPHMHIGPGPFVPMVNGNFNHIMQPPNTAPCIIPEFLPRITENIDSQAALQPPPPPPPVVPLEEISLPAVRETQKPVPTPNMNEELEDMQEALEFAKTLMNMTDDEAELVQSLNMPTFPDLPPIPSTEPSHLVDQPEEKQVAKASKEEPKVDEARQKEPEPEPDPESPILEDQTRTKVVFNVNSTSKMPSQSKQSEETAARLKKIREKLANPTLPPLKVLKPPLEGERKERKKKPEEPAPQEITAPEIPAVSKSPATSSKASKSMLAATVDANWKDKVINQFLKMSKNDICNMVNSSSLRKFDIAMKHLVKERKNALSQERRTSADDAVKGNCDMSREEFMSQLSAMLDPSATVDVKNLPAKFIQHLSEVLKLDVESHLNEAENVTQFDNGGHRFEPQQNFAQFIPAEEILETEEQTMAPSIFGSVFATQEIVDEPVPDMEVLDDIFSAGIARAKLGLVPRFPETSSPPVVDPEPVQQPYIRARCMKTLMNSQPEESADLKDPKSRNSDAWNRKKRQDPDLFRNLTKEEWEARGGNSRDKEPAQSRTPSSRETSLGARSKSPKPQEPKNHRPSRNRSPPTPKNSVEQTRNDSCSDFGSSLSSDGETSSQPRVNKLLKVIKDREKVAKNLTVGESIRDEVNADMERERETEAERKLRKREKCLRRRDRKERLEKESREEEPRVEIKLENPVPIKQEELIIEADHPTVSDTAQKSLNAKSIDKNGETSLSAILFQENNDYANLKSREMLVAREYAGRQVTLNHSFEKVDTKKPQVSVAAKKIATKTETALQRPKEAKIVLEKITNKPAAKKIVGKPETLQIPEKPKEVKVVLEKMTSRSAARKIASKSEAQETRRDQSLIEKPKEVAKEKPAAIKICNKPETQEIRENSTAEKYRTESPVQKLKDAKIVAEKITSREAAKKIGDKPETKEISTVAKIRTESPVQKPKEIKEAPTEKITSRAAAKKITGGTATPEKLRTESPVEKHKETKIVVERITSKLKDNLVSEKAQVEKSTQNHDREKVENKEAKVTGTEAAASTSGTKKIDITVYKARKLQRNFGQRENRTQGVKTRTESEAETDRPKALDETTTLKKKEDSESTTKTETPKKSEAPKVSKPENKEEDKKIKTGGEDRRKQRESERSRSREGSREKSKRVSQESSHGVKRQDKSDAKDSRPHQNNNVLESKERKATKCDKDIEGSSGTEEKIERRQTRDSKKKSEDKLKDKQSRGDSPATRSAKDKRETGSEKKKESKSVDELLKEKENEETREALKQKESENTDEVQKEKESDKMSEALKQKESKSIDEAQKENENENMIEASIQKESEKTDEIEKQKESKSLDEVQKPQKAEKAEEILKQTEVENVEQISEEKKLKDTAETVKEKEAEKAEEILKQKGAEKAEEILKQKEVKKAEKILEQKEAEKAEEIVKQKQEKEAEEIMKQRESEKAEEIWKQKEAEEAEEIVKQKQEKEAKEIMKQRESEKAEEIWKQKEAEEAEEIVKQKEAKNAEEIFKQKESEKAEEILEQRESEKAEEIVKQIESEKAEEILMQKEAEEAEEIVKQKEAEEAEEIMKQKEAEKAEEVLKQKKAEKAEDIVEQKEAEKAEDIVEQKETEKTEEIVKPTEVKNVEEVSEEKEIEKTAEGEAKIPENVPELEEAKATEAKEVKEIEKEKETEEFEGAQTQEEATETEGSKDSEETEESNPKDKKTDETVEVPVPQSIEDAKSTESTEPEEAFNSQEENTAESSNPEAESDLGKQEKDSSENDAIVEEQTEPRIPGDESKINEEKNSEESVSTVFECSNNEVKILLNDLIEKAISQLGLLNASKNHSDGESEAARPIEEKGEASVLDPEEPATVGGIDPSILRDFGVEADGSSPRTPGSPLIGFTEDTINSSILGKRKLAQSVLEITEDFARNKRAKNFDDMMLDMIAGGANIPKEIRGQISKDREAEAGEKIEDAIDNLGAGGLTPSGDTLSLGSSIDFDQGEFIVLSEISSDENFSQDGSLKPVPVVEEKPEDREEKKTDKAERVDVANSEVELNVCIEEKKPEECPEKETGALAEPFVETPPLPDEKVEPKTPKVETSEPLKPEPAKKDSAKAVSPSRERSNSRSLHRVKHRHKTKHKKDKYRRMSEKKVKEVKEVVKDEDIVTLVKKQQTKEVVMNRMIEIDMEIHKLMSEKMKLYHLLESGELPTEENPTIPKEKSNEIIAAKPKSSTSSKTGGSESRKDNEEKDFAAKKNKKTQRHSEPRKTASEKPADGRTSVSKKKHTDEKSKQRSSPSQGARKNSGVREAAFLEDVNLEASLRGKKGEPKKKDFVRKVAKDKKDEAEDPPEPVNNVLQAQQIYSDESSQLSASSLQESAKATNKKGLKGLALLEESYKREKAITKKRRSNVSRASKKEEAKPPTKGALLSSEEDMPLDLLYVKKFRKKSAKSGGEVKRTKSTEVLDHVLEAINAVAENKVEEYQRAGKERSEVQERRVKSNPKGKLDPEETQREPAENSTCEVEAENPESTKNPTEQEARILVESEDASRSDFTESLAHINYDDIPEIDEAFVKIEIEKHQELPQPVVEIHNCETGAVHVPSTSGLKRGKRKSRVSWDGGRASKRASGAKSEMKSCSVRLIDCKYTLLRSFKDVINPPPLLGGDMQALSRSGFFDSEPELRHSEEYDENDLEIMRIHAMSLPPEDDEVVQDFCSLEPESLRTLDETEVDQELMDVALDSGDRDACTEIATGVIPVFEEPEEMEEPVSDVIELELSADTGDGELLMADEGELLMAEDDVLVVAKDPSDEEADEVQEVELPRVQYSVHKGPILDVKVFGDSILAASEDGIIYRYSQTCNGILNTYEGHRSAVTCIYVLPSVLTSGTTRDLLFSGSLDGSLRCYDITTSVQVRGAADVGSPIQCMDQSWGMIYLGTKSGYVFRFHIKSHTFKGDEIKFSEESVLALKATTEGPRRVLIVASRSQPITIRDAKDGLFLRTLSGQKTHTVYSLMMDSNLVYCGTSSTAIPVFDFINGSQTKMYNAGPGVVCMRMYKWLLFAGCYDGNIYVFDTKEQRLVCSIPGPGNMLLSMDIVKNKIVAGSKDRRLHMWRMPEQVLSLLSKRNSVT